MATSNLRQRAREAPTAPPTTAQNTTKSTSAPTPQTFLSRLLLPSPQTLTWSQIAPWQRDNAYILTGYRRPTPSLHSTLSSLLYIHNETTNIYTHLLGALISLYLTHSFYSSLATRYEHANAGDVACFAAFFAGAVVCLGCSAGYHAVSDWSAEVARKGNQVDYVGIVALIWGSFIPSVWLGFARRWDLVLVYWGMITLIGIACGVTTLLPKFRSSAWRPFRAAMFVAMGLSAVAPVVHGLTIYGYEQLNKQMGLNWVVLMGLLYITGAGLYAARIPERLAPGRFDVWGSSHQIFHVLVLMAAAAHFVGLIKAFDYEHGLRSERLAKIGLDQ
ncbi:hypothetical protein MBLNU457_5223t1 [Dothideomycetes sp. NU457]